MARARGGRKTTGRPAARGAASRTGKGRRASPAREPPLPIPRALLDAGSEPDVVELPGRTVVAIDGAGPPDAPRFERSIGAIYAAAWGLKLARKRTGGTFRVGPLEGRWWAEGAAEGSLQAPREAWRWRLRIAVPRDVAGAELAAVMAAAVARKGGKLEGSEEARRVRLERISPARLGRILHLGPYADEPRSFARIDAALAAEGLRPAKPHLEVYLSDPRRTAPAKLRTVLLRELEA